MSIVQPTIETVLKSLNISALNEMQITALETIQNDPNVILLAPTGSGKTLAFLLPILEMLHPDQSGVQAIILSPSRELALQIEQVFRSMSTGYKVNCCYGGHDINVEKNNLVQPPAVLIGTPGRIGDHMRNGRIESAAIQTLVLDEYDKCLEFGFKDELLFVMEQLPNLKKRVLTSATKSVTSYKNTGMADPITLNFLNKTTPKNLKVRVIETADKERIDTLFRLVCKIGNHSTIIFCNLRDTVERISDLLWDQKLPNNIFHGGLEQDLRERTLIKFRNGSHRILVTTDLASRGLDIPEIEYVVHYDLPENESVFTHRSGRTARMHANGTTYLIVSERESIPEFFKESPEYEKLPSKVVIPNPTEWETLYIAAGRKEKISKGDIAGLLMQKGELKKDEVGVIDVLDHVSYVAIKREKTNKVLKLILNAPIKKQKVKIEVAR
jgi:ATP-independent RNA helicase DbpA